MKSFKFDDLDKKLNKKTQKQVNEQRMRQNFLRLYDDIPPDPKMQKYLDQAKQQFKQRLNNNRYYSYDLNKQQELRTQKINKLGNIQMPYKQQPKTDQFELDYKRKLQEINRKDIIRLVLQRKFRYNIKLIMAKMKKARITMQDIMSKGLFSKEPYKFGSEIFSATKDGNSQKVWRILLVNKFSIFSLDNTGKSALTWSCIRNFPKITKLLIDAGSDINNKDISGLNALAYAIKYNSSECVKLIMLEVVQPEGEHTGQLDSAEEKVRNVFNLIISLKRNMKKLERDKREQLFEEQYKYLYQ